MRIGIDVMGGDHAPRVAVLGAIDAAKLVPDCTVVLYGNKSEINEIISEKDADMSNVEIVHTSEVIDMSDSPTSAFQKKPDSSIVVGFNHLKEGLIDGFASAGNTGAMMVGCVYSIGLIEGVMRPTIATVLPKFDGSKFILMDVGLNIDVKPEVLAQYGILGTVYSRSMFGIQNPKVALLNIGEEEEKGSALTKATYQLMKEGDYNFIGNIEGNTLLVAESDVVLCDGFTGNVVLKLLESFSPVLSDNPSLNKSFISYLNYETFGGTPVLGVNAPVIIGHGCSSVEAIKNMTICTVQVAKSSMIKDIKEKIK